MYRTGQQLVNLKPVCVQIDHKPWSLGFLASHRSLLLRHHCIPGKQCALASLATLKAAVGSLSKVKQLVRTLGMVNAPAEFTDHAKVINGFSDTMRDVFGTEIGIGVRSAVGMASLPFNIPAEVETTWELK
jgi:hypothetical protein